MLFRSGCCKPMRHPYPYNSEAVARAFSPCPVTRRGSWDVAPGCHRPRLQRSKKELHFLPPILLSVIQSQCVGSFTTQTFQSESELEVGCLCASPHIKVAKKWKLNHKNRNRSDNAVASFIQRKRPCEFTANEPDCRRRTECQAFGWRIRAGVVATFWPRPPIKGIDPNVLGL